MRYQGGKYMIARRLSEAILNDTDQRGDYYEPFIGGGSMAAHAGFIMHGDPGHFFPADISRADYDYHKQRQPHSPATALIGFGSGFGGKYYGGYTEADTRYSDGRTHHHVARNGLIKKIRGGLLARQTTTFTHQPYENVTPAPGSVIYCDPPYQGTTGYTLGDFDHAKFWEWCRTQARRGCKIYISEYQAPDDFTCIYEAKKRVTLNQTDNTKTAIERLYTYTC